MLPYIDCVIKILKKKLQGNRLKGLQDKEKKQILPRVSEHKEFSKVLEILKNNNE